MTDPLELLWPLVDSAETTVAAHVVAMWPSGVHQRLIGLGFLRPAENAERILCPECHSHIEEVSAISGPNGSTRFVVPCPEVYRAHVPAAALQQWTVDLATIAAALANCLSLTGKCTELVPGRLWRLGRTKWQGTSRDVLLARGLQWDDGDVVRSAAVRNRKPILFVPLCRPPDEVWRRVPPILVLSHVAMLVNDQIEVESLEIAAAVHDADTLAASDSVPALTQQQLGQMIRQQVKAEAKTHLTDDVYIAAYRQCQSVREAAAFLTRETHQEVSKDMVQRAVTRAGGPVAVLNSTDSDSIVRGVASQNRDKRGKPIVQSQRRKEK
jgi:hypothetical protein